MLIWDRSDVGAADIQALVTADRAESHHLEFKERGVVSANGSLTKDGTKQIGRAVVGFANADGGSLVIGVKENENRAGIAGALDPVPDVNDVVARLQDMLRDTVQPRLTGLQILPVSSDENGSGYVVVQVSRSSLAPHGLKGTEGRFGFFVREGASTRPLNVREIQEMTLLSARLADHLEQGFSRRSQLFRDKWQHWSRSGWGTTDGLAAGFGYRLTGIPVGAPLSLGRVIRHRQLVDGVQMPWRQHADGWRLIGEATGQEIAAHDQAEARQIGAWRPIVRGAVLSHPYPRLDGSTGGLVEAEINESGLVESRVFWPAGTLDPLELVREFAMFVAWVNQVMAFSHAYDVEYALEVEVLVEGSVGLGSGGRHRVYLEGTPANGCFPEPRYVLRGDVTLGELTSDFLQDWFDHLGAPLGDNRLLVMRDGRQV